MIDTYEAGVTQVVIVLFAALFAVSLLDALCELFDLPSIGERVDRWSNANGWYAGALILLMAVFLAHFLLNPLPCSAPAPSAAPTIAVATATPAPTPPRCPSPSATPTARPG